ncbi:MAG TPA: nickel ABC transporter ATP-binding protein [Pelotomaculum sp.]|nr:nickel ABC transporter ATP-binding protein [Pelotomaculum sp.]
MSEKIIYQLQNLGYSYPSGEEALINISLNVHQGERLILMGANGSGKSTLLKLMNGLIFPSQGMLYAFGENINEKNLNREDFAYAFRRKVGFVFQNSDAQLFNPTVVEEIAFGPVQMGLTAVEVKQRVEEIITLLGLEHLRNRPPFKLSGGEKKKVALASVLSINPDVLLLDEPTDGLDPRTQRWLINLIQQLNEAKKTIIMSTHNLEIIEKVADRVAIIGEDHQLVALDSRERIMNKKSLLIRVNLIDDGFTEQHIHADTHRHQHLHD